jgi:hypothetical protein
MANVFPIVISLVPNVIQLKGGREGRGVLND